MMLETIIAEKISKQEAGEVEGSFDHNFEVYTFRCEYDGEEVTRMEVYDTEGWCYVDVNEVNNILYNLSL